MSSQQKPKNDWTGYGHEPLDDDMFKNPEPEEGWAEHYNPEQAQGWGDGLIVTKALAGSTWRTPDILGALAKQLGQWHHHQLHKGVDNSRTQQGPGTPADETYLAP
eukprot:3512868-Amphidinium_carterae.1